MRLDYLKRPRFLVSDIKENKMKDYAAAQYHWYVVEAVGKKGLLQVALARKLTLKTLNRSGQGPGIPI